MHRRAFEILAAQNGRVGTLSNQFGELLVAAGVPDAARYGAEWAMKAPRSAIAILTSARRRLHVLQRRFLKSENVAFRIDDGLGEAFTRCVALDL